MMSVGTGFARIANALVATLCIVLAACTTVETQSFRTTGNSEVESAYIATDADFSKYDRLLIDDMGIYFPTNARVPEEDQQRIRSIFRNAFTAELKNYRITREPGPGMLRVQASIVDLRYAAAGDIPSMSREVASIARSGALLFMMELRDSGTDKVLARAADSAANPRFAYATGEPTDWQSVEDAAARWARLFREFLDRNLKNAG